MSNIICNHPLLDHIDVLPCNVKSMDSGFVVKMSSNKLENRPVYIPVQTFKDVDAPAKGPNDSDEDEDEAYH